LVVALSLRCRSRRVFARWRFRGQSSGSLYFGGMCPYIERMFASAGGSLDVAALDALIERLAAWDTDGDVSG
jgi:hypothetical protein